MLDGLFNMIGTGVSTGMSIAAQKDMQQKEFQQQNSLLNTQNSFTREMWQANNEYNDPAAQMQRMVAAGINPDAAAQGISGAPSAGSASQVSSSSAPGVNSIASSLGQTISNSVNSFWQNELLKRQVEYQDKVTDKYDALTDASIADINSQIEQRKHQNLLTDAEEKTAREMLPLLKNKTRADINNVLQSTKKLIQETKNARKQYDVLEKSIEQMDADIQLKQAETGVANSQKNLLDENVIREKWRNLFIDSYGADPDTPWITELITSVLSGKGADALNTVITQLEDLIKSVFTGSSDSDVNHSFPKFPKYRGPRNAKELIFGWNPFSRPGASGSW